MTLHLNVKPGSKVDQLFHDASGPGRERLLNVRIKAPAQDGRANAYLIEFLAKQFGVAKTNVTIVAGFTSRRKRIEIDAEESVIRVVLARLTYRARPGRVAFSPFCETMDKVRGT